MSLSSRQLSIPRTGTSLKLLASERAQSGKITTFAAWQSPEKGTPKRVVIRLDGDASPDGYPCAVALVRYSIGGLTREVSIDCAGQSALVVWCESVDVTAKWDERRISRITFDETILVASSQVLTAAISAGADAGDQGAADARYLDAILPDILVPEGEGYIGLYSLHPIPHGARGVRFLDGFTTEVISTPELATIIAFTAQPLTAGVVPSAPQLGVIEYVTNGATDTSLILVPAGAKQLWLYYALPNAITDITAPAFIEWILSPSTVPNGY